MCVCIYIDRVDELWPGFGEGVACVELSRIYRFTFISIYLYVYVYIVTESMSYTYICVRIYMYIYIDTESMSSGLVNPSAPHASR